VCLHVICCGRLEKVYLKAIQPGISTGLFFKSDSMGVGSSMSSLSCVVAEERENFSSATI